MKRLKKIVSIVLTAVMVLAMCIPVMANVDLSNHTFAAYQIFTGKYENDKLSNVAWGNGVDSAALMGEGLLADCKSAEDIADKLTANTIGAQAFADVVAKHLNNGNAITGTGTINLPEAGYYLIEDTTDVSGVNDAKNFTLLKVSARGEVTPQVKTDKPSLEKKVQDINDITGDKTGWQDSADYDIGDEIPYQLTATMGDLSNYKTYYVKFHDTMTHLTFKEITTVKVGDTVLRENQYTAKWSAASKELTVAIDDVKAYDAAKETKVVVEYKATLDEDAVIGSAGNPNTAYLEYSNNPNNAGAGETGKTPEDKNIVFTYKTVVNKVDQDGNPLEGARFELFKEVNGEWISKGTPEAKANDEDNKNNVFEWSGLDDGKYKLVETVTPNEYNTIQPIEFTISADHEAASDAPKLISLAGGDKFTGNVSNGTLTTAIENKLGSTLPETGGIGTTVFYVVGVILMLGAGVLLVTKKRMSSNR